MMKKIALCAALAISACSLLFAEDVFRVSSPAGAPAVALSMLAKQNPEQYSYVAAEAIAAEFASQKADFIVAPVNAGAKLYKLGKSSYKLCAVVSWGNLYIASQRPDFSLADIAKYGITLFGENTINASVALYALEKSGITPKSVSYLAGAANTQSLLLTDREAIVITAEPALTAAKMKNKAITSYPLNELYKKAAGFEGYAQAGLFVKEATLKEKPAAVTAYLATAQKAVQECTSNLDAVAKTAVELEILPNQNVAKQAIPNCNLRYVSARKARAEIEQTAKIDLKQFGGALPAADFYYEED